MSEVNNPILDYADSYRLMERQGTKTVGIWSVITDLERNMAPLMSDALAREAALREELATSNRTASVISETLTRVGAERDALQQRLTAAEQRNADGQRDAERYRKLQKMTPYRFKKMQDASVTDGGDVLYFHADKFDALMDAELAKPTESGASE